MPPRVSVVMSVHNGDQYLGDAVESILCQSFEDFEFIVIDDGSQDKSNSIIREFARRDERIRIIENNENLGLSTSLNKGIFAARGEYIARMDADDLSHVDRLRKQVDFMDANLDVGICGTWVQYFGLNDKVIKFPLYHEEIHALLLFQNVLIHPSIMMRSAEIKKHALYYDEDISYAQDYELWSRAVTQVNFANVNQVLLQYRLHSRGIGSRFNNEQFKIFDVVFRRMLSDIGLQPSDDEIRLHTKISANYLGSDLFFLRCSHHWLGKISNQNRISPRISPEILDQALGDIWARVCYSHLQPIKVLCLILFQRSQFKNSVIISKIIEKNWPCVNRLLSSNKFHYQANDADYGQ